MGPANFINHHRQTFGELFLILIILLSPFPPAYAQFLNLSLEIEPELRVETLRDLDFGTIVQNSGVQRVTLGDANMGVFSITALKNINVRVFLNTPQYLEHTDSSIDDRVPLNLNASYTNQGEDNPEFSQPFQGQTANFSILSPNIATSPDELMWESAYIYVYGSIEVGTITEGRYTGQVTVTVEYE